MSAPVIFAQIPFGSKAETLRVALTDGGHVLDLRACSPISSTSRTLSPTGRGVTLAVDHLPKLIRALQAAQAKAVELGLIGGDA